MKRKTRRRNPKRAPKGQLWLFAPRDQQASLFPELVKPKTVRKPKRKPASGTKRTNPRRRRH